MLLRTMGLLVAWAMPVSLGGAGLTGAEAAPQAAPAVAAWEVTAEQQAAAELTYALLSNGNYAYRPRPMGPGVSEQVFDRYVRALDPQGMYLTQADLDGLAGARASLGRAVEGKDLAPALAIYRRWDERVRQRLQQAQGWLTEGFDFTEHDTWRPRDERSPRPRDEAQARALWHGQVKGDWLRLRLAGQTDAGIRATLAKRYARAAADQAKATAADALDAFLNAYAATLDPHTNYLAPQDATNFVVNMSLSVEGIGAIMQEQDGQVVVRSLLAGGPAARSGQLKVGDQIVAIGQGDQGPWVDVVGRRVEDIVALVRGKNGTPVRLGVVPAGGTGQTQRITLTRARVALEEQRAQRSVIEVGGARVGVVRLPTFYVDIDGRRRGKTAHSASLDVARLLTELKAERVSAVVVDLRGNGGGALNEAIDLAGLFIDVGPVVQVRGTNGKIGVEGDQRAGVAWAGPLAVLVDKGSASASEIFAAAIQDYGRGLIVGETTYGKGTVQSLIDLDGFVGSTASARQTPALGQVKLTIAQFFRINGATTQRDGVRPDVAFPVTADGDQAGEAALDNALPPSLIAPARYAPVDRWQAWLADVRHAHAQRAKQDPALRWWFEDVQRFRADRDKHVVSLNESERRAQIAQRKAQLLEREKERSRLGLPAAPSEADDGLYANERPLAEQVREEQAAKDQAKNDPVLREAAHVIADTLRLRRLASPSS